MEGRSFSLAGLGWGRTEASLVLVRVESPPTGVAARGGQPEGQWAIERPEGFGQWMVRRDRLHAVGDKAGCPLAFQVLLVRRLVPGGGAC